MDKEQLNAKLDALKQKSKDFLDTMGDKYSEGKEAIAAAAENAKSEINRSLENARLSAERGKSKLYAELLKASMTYDQKKKELDEYLADKKYENARDRAKAKAEKAGEYADDAMEFALMAIDEAQLAYLDAVQLRLAYEEQFEAEEKSE